MLGTYLETNCNEMSLSNNDVMLNSLHAREMDVSSFFWHSFSSGIHLVGFSKDKTCHHRGNVPTM